MQFGSVCSGIEAASVAWKPLGWRAQFVSEIEPFPCAVLSHHYPDVPNRGDMTKFKDWPDATLDVLCGGTPCQSFSVAGLRKGLDDPRGNLMLTFGAIAARHRPRWLVWENVPGVLSSNGGRDFGTFLGLLGFIGYGFAYRVLDAQYFGLAQRRKRVFVVGCLGDWRSAAAVLFERDSLSGNPAPSRQTRQDVAPTVAGGARKRGGYSSDDIPSVVETMRGHPRPGSNSLGMLAFGGNQTSGPRDVASALSALSALSAHGGTGRHDFESETFVTHALTGEGFDASEDGTGRGTPLTIAFDCKASGQSGFGVGNIASTQRAMGHASSHTNGGGHQAVAYSTKLHNTASNQAGKVYREYTAGLDANSPPPALLTAMQVRRLTPEECEALQGFERGYTAITHRGKPAADGPRYKALGNSWAVPNVRWIGRRIDTVDAITRGTDPCAR